MPRSLMARDRVLGQGLLLRLGISMMLLGSLLPSTDSSPHPLPQFASYEVIVPRKLAPKEGKATNDEVSYVIKAEGKNHIVHLKQKKGFLVKNFPVFTYDARGQLRVDLPHIPDDCYYHGYVEDTPESHVALSTCSGLRGFLQIGSLNYGIEPVETSFTFQHRLYRTEEMEPKAVTCGLTAKEINYQASETERRQVPKAEAFHPWTHTKYMELLIVVDKLRFEYSGRNITNVSMQVVDVVSMVDELFYPLRLRILLTGLEIWTESNPIKITHNISEVLFNFNLWRKRHIYPRAPHDVGHLFVYMNFGANIGKAYLRSVCDKKRASGVEAFMHGPSREFAVLFAHELGHNIGMKHDGKECVCANDSTCIMNAHHTQVHQFSNCSSRDYFDLTVSGQGRCLNNIPEIEKLFHVQYCGNFIVDPGEQCDCEEMEPKAVTCGLTAKEIKYQASETERRQVPKAEAFHPWTHTKYMELLIVVDKLRFEYSGRNITNVSMQVVDVVSMVDELFYPLRLRILLTGLEIWTESNPIKITHNISEVLFNFNLWRKRHIYPRAPHDVGHLFVYMNFGANIGKAYLRSVCDKKRASGVEAFMHGPSREFAVLFAHELGHNIGMKHDGKECVCANDSTCIMNAHHTQVHQFSNCSSRDYFDLTVSGQGRCLNNIPEIEKLFHVQYCGNFIVDPGEQCDCGSKKQCKKDPCCDHTCQLKPGAICAFGQCCHKCQFLPEGRTCRKKTSECDLPEYCNGTSPWCQENVYMQDGTLCSDNGYCFHGFCSTHNLQCQHLFGKAAKAAPESCFKEVNLKGDRFGNCGGDGGDGKFEQCKLENILCGRVQCVNVKRIPWGEDHTTLIQTPVDNMWCWGTDFHVGMELSDTGIVEDGAKCGTNKICINHTCVNETTVLTSDCTVKKCGGRGVCNSNGNCHCNDGWAPPNCQFAGFGGSIDSGCGSAWGTLLESRWIRMTSFSRTHVNILYTYAHTLLAVCSIFKKYLNKFGLGVK
uniref:ADAM metallopeptidase domain 9 n=1 Tax=Gopherus agassizii TaxID=38772 RepID=A0A452GVW0_9SAUR